MKSHKGVPHLRGHTLSSQATELYMRIGSSFQPDPDDPALHELLENQLIAPVPHRPGTFTHIDRLRAERHQTEQIITQIAEKLVELRSLPALFDALPPQMRSEGGISFIDNIADANEAIAAALAAVKSDLLTSHPEARPAERIDQSRERDVALAARGITVRTIYAHAARARRPETAWADSISQYGGEVRTLHPPFERFIIVDTTHAFCSDHLDTPTQDSGAWLVTHPAVVAVLRSVFEHQWMRAAPWLGGAATQQAEATATTPEQRAILRYMDNGFDDTRIARELGTSTRTLGKYIADIKTLFGVESRFQIGSAWARHPDYLISD
ncbi:hypothetical protein [Streptomyces sp. PA5.6]|uniref:hypothetical protein n=1 Tax=Streptomyces sp. PA5.6 TaxID=3035651 RepID=UPI003904AD6B